MASQNDIKNKKHEMQSSAYSYLYLSLKSMYAQGLNQLVSPAQMRSSNAFCGLGLSAFIVATAAWESYMNFVFFSVWTKAFFGETVHQRMKSLEESHDGLSLSDKTFSPPLIAFGKTFSKGNKPFQGLVAMIGIRNAIVHNYMHRSPKNHLEQLYKAKVQMPPTPNPTAWTVEISTLESIRWCADLLGDLSEVLHKIPEQPSPAWKVMFPRFSVKEANEMIRERFPS